MWSECGFINLLHDAGRMEGCVDRLSFYRFLVYCSPGRYHGKNTSSTLRWSLDRLKEVGHSLDVSCLVQLFDQTSDLASLIRIYIEERNKIDAVTKSQLSTFLMELVAFTDQHKANSSSQRPLHFLACYRIDLYSASSSMCSSSNNEQRCGALSLEVTDYSEPLQPKHYLNCGISTSSLSILKLGVPNIRKWRTV